MKPPLKKDPGRWDYRNRKVEEEMLGNMKLACNAGLSKEEYDRIRITVAQQNAKTLRWVSFSFAIFMFLLAGATFLPFFTSLRVNCFAYVLMGIAAVVIFILNRPFETKYLNYSKYLFYFFMLIISIFSIYIGVITNTDQRSSTICVLLLTIPLLLTDKPWRISLFLSITVLLFCITTYAYKDYDLFVVDTINCCCIFIISIAVNFTHQIMKYRSINDEYIIKQNNLQTINRQKMELEESKIAIILSQIQPHFLYNALLVIQELCIIDPKEAEQATIEFSRFLRGNLDSLNADKPIPFEKELQHTKYYLALEQKRFGKRLHIEWDIRDTSFFIPALTLQPIVENAVRYGVTKKEDGGTVKISSMEENGQIKIVVQDDGMGFDIFQPKEDGRTHIGIQNVRKRLEDMCGGTLVIESTKGVGTRAAIMIPGKGRL